MSYTNWYTGEGGFTWWHKDDYDRSFSLSMWFHEYEPDRIRQHTTSDIVHEFTPKNWTWV